MTAVTTEVADATVTPAAVSTACGDASDDCCAAKENCTGQQAPRTADARAAGARNRRRQGSGRPKTADARGSDVCAAIGRWAAYQGAWVRLRGKSRGTAGLRDATRVQIF